MSFVGLYLTPTITPTTTPTKIIEYLRLRSSDIFPVMHFRPGFRSFRMLLKPTYPCDEWDRKRRTCYVNRNIGDTVTFVLTKGESKRSIPRINWKQEFHIRGQSQRRQLNLSAGASGNPTWNIVIGNRGQELRLSPITEMDVDPNSFSATLDNVEENIARTPYARISFRIRPIPIDMGFVYPGETLILNIESYITLPPVSLRYVWYMEKDRELGTMPSNMKTSLSGTTLQISELRKEQEGIMACAIYTNLDILIAKKRFLIKEIIPNRLENESQMQTATEVNTTPCVIRNLCKQRQDTGSVSRKPE
ncbi:uncharacterized protein TNCV_2570391 [Trichonephila clavipes]|nr:uncharacterized protein TNCV_2570391 [Trichonephila clavipes]